MAMDEQTWFVTDISIEKPMNAPDCVMETPGVPPFWSFTGIVEGIAGVGTGGGISVVGLYAATPEYCDTGTEVVAKAAWLLA